MNILKIFSAGTALVVGIHSAQAAAPASATAISVAGLSVGATVFGPEGGEVGKIVAINGDVVVVNTGTHSAGLAKSAFGSGKNGPVIGLTKSQLDDAAEASMQQTESKLAAALIVGAAVRSADGQPVGTVKSIGNDGTVVIEGAGRTFALKKDVFATDATGLILRITAKDLNDALNKVPEPASGK